MRGGSDFSRTLGGWLELQHVMPDAVERVLVQCQDPVVGDEVEGHRQSRTPDVQPCSRRLAHTVARARWTNDGVIGHRGLL